MKNIYLQYIGYWVFSENRIANPENLEVHENFFKGLCDNQISLLFYKRILSKYQDLNFVSQNEKKRLEK